MAEAKWSVKSPSFAYATLADHGYIGFTFTGTAGCDLTGLEGRVVYLAAVDSKWELCLATASTTMSVAPAIVVAGAAENATVTLMAWGYMRHTAWGFAAVHGSPIYIDKTTPGLVTVTAPSLVGEQVQIIGEVTDVDNIILFNPSQLLLEVSDGSLSPTIGTIADGATLYPSSNGLATGTKVQHFTVTACAQATAFATPPGSWSDGDKLSIRIYGAAQQTLSFPSPYRFSSDLSAPATTTAGKTMYIGFIYNSTATAKWDCTGFIDNF